MTDLVAAAALPLAGPLDQLDQVMRMLTDPAGWLLDSIFQGSLGSPLQLLRVLLQLPLQGNAILHEAWQSLALASTGLVGVAAAARGVRLAVNPDARPASVILETVIRAGVVVGAIQLSYEALLWAFQASTSLSAALLAELISRSGTQDLGTWLALRFIPDLGGVLKLAIFASGLYVGVMLVIARLLMLFSIVTAPVVIPLAAYSERAEVLGWWARLTLGSLLAPPVSAVLVGVTAILAASGSQVVPVPGLGSGIAVAGGFLLLGHALRHLTVHTFQIGHGVSTASVALGVLAARTAVMVAAPEAAPAVGAAGGASGAGGDGGLGVRDILLGEGPPLAVSGGAPPDGGMAYAQGLAGHAGGDGHGARWGAPAEGLPAATAEWS